MPNWCNNYLTFNSDGTPEGDMALQDLHDKIVNTQKLMSQLRANQPYGGSDLWEVHLAHFGYGVDIDCYQRGYIFFISDVEYGIFHVETDDAWSPNITFWNLLISYFYGDKINFTFQACEPGMGIYETNDPGLLPRYVVDLYPDTVDNMLKLDKVWDWSNPLFPRLDSDRADVSESKFIPTGYDYNETPYKVTGWEYYIGRPFMYESTEGDEDECLEYLEDYVTINENDTIESVEERLDGLMCVHQYEYVPLEAVLDGEEITNAAMGKLTNGEYGSETYKQIKPIYDNFTTFFGGGNSE